MDETDLDRAHGAMIAAPDDDRARLAYYHRLADGELYLLLRAEPQGESLEPVIFTLDDARYALAFDTDERLAGFAAGPQPYAALPGRVIAAQLAGQGIGLGVNLGSAETAFLMAAPAVDWLAEALAHAPAAGGAAPLAYFAPDLPGLATAVSDKLAGHSALASVAYLAGARLADGLAGHVLVFEDAQPAAEAALAKATGEAVVFFGADPDRVELIFMSAGQIAATGLARHADRIEITAPPAPSAPAAQSAPSAPGSDPAKPPRLR